MAMMNRRVIVWHLTAMVMVAGAPLMEAGQDAIAPSTASAHVGSPAVGPAPRPGRPVPPVGNEDRIGHGDKLRIEGYKDQQLSQSVQVRPDGRITLPLVGDLVAVDQTPIQLRDRITAALKDYVTSPTVTVIVVEATAAMAYVMGEVNRPGTVPLQGAPLTVIQALALAGVLKDFADVKNIRILRRSPAGVQAIPFNYKDAIRGSAPVYLQTGDTIVVPD